MQVSTAEDTCISYICLSAEITYICPSVECSCIRPSAIVIIISNRLYDDFDFEGGMEYLDYEDSVDEQEESFEYENYEDDVNNEVSNKTPEEVDVTPLLCKTHKTVFSAEFNQLE